MSESIIFAHFLFFGEWFERFTHDRSIPLSNVSKSLRLLTKIREVSESLRLLTKNEQPWAIRSGCSEEMSDVSELLILLTKNERMSESLIFLSESLICSFLGKKRAICSENRWANCQPCPEH